MQVRAPWNAGKTVGTKRPLTQKQIWAIRYFLDREGRLRDRALFDLAIDSKLAMKVRDVLEDEGVSSFAFADTQEGAVAAAVSHTPDLISSDVKLINGTGPLAMSTIHRQLGDVPVVFITATPGECVPCAPPGQVICKPLDESELAKVVHQMVQF